MKGMYNLLLFGNAVNPITSDLITKYFIMLGLGVLVIIGAIIYFVKSKKRK